MNLLSTIGNLLLSEWIWGMMFGWAYVCSNIICLTIALKKILPTSYQKALLITIGANVTAFISYSFVVIAIFMNLLKWFYVPVIHEINKPFQAHILLAIIYTTLYITFFSATYTIFRIKLNRAVIAITISSILATLISYYYLILTVGIIFTS